MFWRIRVPSFLVLCWIFSLYQGKAQAPGVTVISWNIRDFGQSRNDEEIDRIASLIRHADIVAIQEVVAGHPGGAQAVGKLAEALKRLGNDWDYRISDPTRSPNPHVRERYAFLWKPDRVILRGRPYLMTEVDPEVHREPYIGIFQAVNGSLTILNYHSRTHEDEREVEMEEIAAITQQLKQFEPSDILWLGDFNLSQQHPAFLAVKKLGYRPLFSEQKTTLKTTCKDGNYLSSEEDNIFYKPHQLKVLSTDVVDFMRNKDCHTLAEWRKIYSDHLPLEVRLGR
jgi:endonuclease/exonuclease/phosphatase family metal-dependent hydrolase